MKVFVISPIGSPGTEKHHKATLTLDYIIKKALPEDRWEVTRGDASLSPDSIGHDIIKRINEADLVVADLTDHNANVFYELAIAHGWDKPVIHIIEDGQAIPFDIADLRVVSYKLSDPASVDRTINIVSGMSQEVMKSDYKPITPLTQYRSFANVTASLDPESAETEMSLEILKRLAAIEESIRTRPLDRTDQARRRIDETTIRKSLSTTEIFLSQAQRAAMMNNDRDDYDVSEIKNVLKFLANQWEALDPISKEELHSKLFDMGIPFPDITTVPPVPQSRSHRITR